MEDLQGESVFGLAIPIEGSDLIVIDCRIREG